MTMTYNQILFYVILALTALNSIIAFAMFFSDKKKAIRGDMRTKEKDLLFISVLFGAPGAALSRSAAHHKTDKAYFGIVIYFSLLLQAIELITLFYSAYLI